MNEEIHHATSPRTYERAHRVYRLALRRLRSTAFDPECNFDIRGNAGGDRISRDNSVVHLISEPKRYTVRDVARAPIAVLDAELPVADVLNQFVVQVEDGREFSNCLMESLKTTAARFVHPMS